MSFRSVSYGFQNDMEELFTRFLKGAEEQTSSAERPLSGLSLRFSRFSECWRQMNFSLVFRYRFHENDLREFIEELYFLVLPNVGSEHPLERRVSALYLLYSLFVKQPKTVCQKIRIKVSFLEQIHELVKMCKQLEQFDVCFVWYKLCSLGAIDLVLMSRQVGPDFIRNSRVTEGKETGTDILVNQFKSSVYPSLKELSDIHEEYRNIKELLSEDNPIISEEFKSIEENIFETNKSMADQILMGRDKTLDGLVVTSDTNVPKVCQQINERTDSDMGSKRRQLKDRTNTTNGKVEKLERKYGPNTNKEVISESRKKAKGKRGRPKLAPKWRL